MNLKAISRNVGYALLVSALFMFLSIVVSILNGRDSALAALIISFLITAIVGAFPFIFVRKSTALTMKDGYMTIFLSWLLSFVFGMLPYALWGGPFTVVNAWFESVSGFTTTGATILTEVEALPRSLLFWRASTHFIGGLGVVVFLLLVIPNSSPVRLRLTNMELSSLSRDTYASRANKTVTIFASVYIGLMLSAFISYALAGMPIFDALCHAFSVGATGGFSTRTASIGAFGSDLISIITIVFMFLGSVHYGIIFMVFAGRTLRPLKNPVLKYYVVTLLIMIVTTVLSLKFQGPAMTWGRAAIDGTFQIVSYASTTGFATADNAVWPMLPCFLLVIMSVQCGCAGSTTGGIKCDRFLMLWKSIGRHINHTLHPSTIKEIRIGKSAIRDEDLFPSILYISMYFLVMIVSVVVCLIVGDNSSNALTGTLSCLGNVGPALGDIGSMGNFDHLTGTTKMMFTLDMFMGRVEIYPLLAAVSLIFRPKGR